MDENKCGTFVRILSFINLNVLNCSSPAGSIRAEQHFCAALIHCKERCNMNANVRSAAAAARRGVDR